MEINRRVVDTKAFHRRERNDFFRIRSANGFLKKGSVLFVFLFPSSHSKGPQHPARITTSRRYAGSTHSIYQKGNSNMKRTTFLTVATILSMGFASICHADDCGIPYASHDQATIQRLLAGPIFNSNDRGIGGALLRMHELALLCATGVFSTTQRMALENEYFAWRLEIDRIGSSGNGARLRRRSSAWLDRIVDPEFLEIADTRINGATIEESQRNASVAAGRLANAIQKMWACY